MLATLRLTTTLLKLRIGVMIAATALAGMAAAGWQGIAAWQAVVLMVAVLGASGAAGAFNHYHERELDKRMSRTRNRPFASGALRPSLWWPVGFTALLLASLLLAWAATGGLAALFVFLGAFTYGIVYTVWLKQRSVLNIVIGGLAGSFAVLAGAYAVTPAPSAEPIILAIVLFLWTPPHFWSLAGAKGEDYRAAGVPMLSTVAPAPVWTLVVALHTLALVAVSLVPLFLGASLYYAVGAIGGGALFLWRSLLLWQAPSAGRAMANFGASLLQLALLLAGIFLDAALRVPA
ncbi:MAG: protoheme IX farnesyltransferase [Alphaproteobacteria bacterium]|nr:protoheme IX farnesyltransferase [Alphaproteobacteria bacterium]